MATAGLRIEGLTELRRSLAKMSRELNQELGDALKKAVEPVRAEAEHKAFATIRNIGSIWGRMRTGSTQSTVYVAPATRRRGGSPRPNLGTLLMDQAMWPALEEKQDSIEQDVANAFDRLAFRAGFH